MAQIVVRNIPDAEFEVFKARAQRLGRSTEEEVRRLIVETAETDEKWRHFTREADALRESVRRRAGVTSDSVETIRKMRRSR